MESTNTNAKTITVSFMVGGILVGLVASVMMETLATVSTGAFGRAVSGDIARHVLPVALGFITYLVLQTSKPVMTWANEVVTEISRVVWPSRKDTMAMTLVVCIMVVISGAYFGVLDVLSGAVVDWLLHQNFFGLFS